MKEDKVLMAEKGLHVIILGKKAVIHTVFPNRFIMYIEEDGKKGGASYDNAFKGLNGEIIKHPNYFKLFN